MGRTSLCYFIICDVITLCYILYNSLKKHDPIIIQFDNGSTTTEPLQKPNVLNVETIINLEVVYQ